MKKTIITKVENTKSKGCLAAFYGILGYSALFGRIIAKNTAQLRTAIGEAAITIGIKSNRKARTIIAAIMKSGMDGKRRSMYTIPIVELITKPITKVFCKKSPANVCGIYGARSGSIKAAIVRTIALPIKTEAI